MQLRDQIRLAAVTLTLGLGVAVSAFALAHDGTQHGSAANDQTDEGPFLAENDAAMTKMMNDMAVKPALCRL